MPTQTCASIFDLLDKGQSADTRNRLLLACMADLFQPVELTELWEESTEGAWLDAALVQMSSPWNHRVMINRWSMWRQLLNLFSKQDIMLSFFRKMKSYNVRELFFFSEQNPNSWGGCFGHAFYSHTLSQMSQFFSQQKTRWVLPCSLLPGVKNLLMELEMPTSNTQCCCVLLVLTWLVTCSAGWKTGLEGQRAQSGCCRLWAVFLGLNFCFCFPEQKAWVGFQLP